jgi:hypothetical protein
LLEPTEGFEAVGTGSCEVLPSAERLFIQTTLILIDNDY